MLRVHVDCGYCKLVKTWSMCQNRSKSAKQSGSKCCESLGVGTLQQMVWSQNFSHWYTEMHDNRLLGSADPGHIESGNRSAAKKTDDGYQCKACPRRISSELNMCGNDCCYSSEWWTKTEL